MKWISEVNTLNNKESRLGGGPSPCIPHKPCKLTLCPNLCIGKSVCGRQNNCIKK